MMYRGYTDDVAWVLPKVLRVLPDVVRVPPEVAGLHRTSSEGTPNYTANGIKSAIYNHKKKDHRGTENTAKYYFDVLKGFKSLRVFSECISVFFSCPFALTQKNEKVKALLKYNAFLIRRYLPAIQGMKGGTIPGICRCSVLLRTCPSAHTSS